MRSTILIVLTCLLATYAVAEDTIPSTPYTLHFTQRTFTLDEIIGDIYSATTEFSEVNFEQLQSDLYAIHDSPIDLNNTSDEELSQLYFLSPQQIDAILMYADEHHFHSLYELRMVQELADYEIRDLLPFVTITNANANANANAKLYPREVFAYASHEIITRVDARNIEGYSGTDPMYVSTRYRFDYHRRVIFGAQLRRPAGGSARDLQYGAYLQLNDIAPHLHTVVAGNFQASFGQGLVLAPVFHAGKSMYTTSVGQQRQGLRYYSSVDGEGLHGAGATLRWQWSKATRLDASALYSMRRANDSTWHHLIGANITLRHKQLQVELTAIENLWSDSIRPYNNAAYNQHYFRGTNQAVLGASFRYNHGWFDLFGEVATAQNKITNVQSQMSNDKWGIGVIAGSRFYPTSGVSLLALYRYYSPFFDNALGYAFSETSRIGDENGGYLGFEITRLRNWRFSGYGDVFYFSGPKYGIPDSPSLGYDAVINVRYNGITSSRNPQITNYKSQITNDQWWLDLRARARKKGTTSTYSLRMQYNHQLGPLSLRTTGEANLTSSKLSTLNSQLNYGVTVYQDLAYDFTPYTIHHTPISLKFRAQFFDARDWSNRIYCYEHDVLYAYSIPAVYGLGGRFYACLRWQIIPQLTLYFRASETIYAKQWAATHDRPQTRTDFHLLFRAKL